MNEFMDGYKLAVNHLKQVLPSLRKDWQPLVEGYISRSTEGTPAMRGDVLDRLGVIMDELSSNTNTEKAKTVFEWNRL